MASEKKTMLDLNAVSEEELEAIAGVGPARAHAVIERRNELGSFRSWDDLLQARGLSEGLVQTLREHASLGAAMAMADGNQERANTGATDSGTGDGMMDGTADGDGMVDDEADDPELDALAAIAQMDLEAALAYEAAAELIMPDPRSDTLLEFARDHRQHVRELVRMIDAEEEDFLASISDSEQSVFVNLTSALGTLGIREALTALIGNEQFTNQTYMTALEIVADDELRAILDRNFGDEQRHVAWLTEQRRQLDSIEAQADGEIAQPRT